MTKKLALILGAAIVLATPMTALADSADQTHTGDRASTIVSSHQQDRFSDVAMVGTDAIAVGEYADQKAIVMKFDAGGRPVTDFGKNGRRLIKLPGWGSATDVKVQPNGKLLVLASVGTGFSVIRLNEDGSLDRTFGHGGMVTRTTNGQFSIEFAVDSRNRPIVALGEETSKHDIWATRIHLWRFTRHGDVDRTFAGGDVTWAPQRVNMVAGIVTDNSDRILLVTNQFSDKDNGAGISLVRVAQNGGTKQQLRRYSQYKKDGTWAIGLDRTSAGALFVGTTGATSSLIGVIAFTRNGTLNKSYGQDGHVEGRCVAECYLASQELTDDGHLYLAGGVRDPDLDGYTDDSWLARLTPRGAWDNSFGTSGQRIMRLFSQPDMANSVTTGSDGQLFIAGQLGKARSDAYLVHTPAS